MEIELPKELSTTYQTLKEKFAKVEETYGKYDDQIIPVDEEFKKTTLTFIIDLCKYISVNFSEINKADYQEFISHLHEEFEYGEHGDDNNYIDFEPHIDDEPLSTHLHEFDEFFTKKTINEFKTKLTKLLTKL